MHRPDDGPSGEKIRARTSQLPGAGPRENESNPGAFFHEGVDGGKDLRDTLHLVDDQGVPGTSPLRDLADPFRPRREPPEDIRFQEIDDDRSWKPVPNPR